MVFGIISYQNRSVCQVLDSNFYMHCVSRCINYPMHYIGHGETYDFYILKRVKKRFIVCLWAICDNLITLMCWLYIRSNFHNNYFNMESKCIEDTVIIQKTLISIRSIRRKFKYSPHYETSYFAVLTHLNCETNSN